MFNDLGAPANLTGYTASMYIAKYFGSDLKYSVSSQVTDPTNGKLLISINPESTTLLPAGAMQYTIYLKPSSGDGFIILQGQAIIIPSVF